MKNRKGRKERNPLEGAKKITHELVSRNSVIHEKNVMNITFSFYDSNLMNNMIMAQYLISKGIFDDTAGLILSHLVSNTKKVDGLSVNFESIAEISEKLTLAYATVQKVLKKLKDKGVVARSEETKGLYLTEETSSFLNSIKNNKQIVLTFQTVDEQLDMFEEDGVVNLDNLEV